MADPRVPISAVGESLEQEKREMTIDLPVIWFAIIVFATLMYIVMDGFTSGCRYICFRLFAIISTIAMLW